MGEDFQVIGKIVVDSSGAIGIQQVNSSLDQMGEKTNTLKGATSAFGDIARYVWANIVLEGINKAITAMQQMGTEVLSTAEDMQKSQALIQNQLQKTGAQTGLTSDLLNQYADSLSRTTTFSKANVMAAEAMGLQYTNIGKDIFPRAINAAADFATKMGMDLPQATATVFRALQDPINGFGSLTRVIGQVDPALKKQVEDLAKHGETAQADALMLDYLNKAMGGAAEAAGTTFAAKWTILKNTVIDALATALMPVLDWLSAFMSNLMASEPFQNFIANIGKLPEVFRSITSAISGGGGGLNLGQMIMGGMGTGLVNLTKNFSDMMKSIDWKKVSDQFAEGIRSIDWSKAGSEFTTALQNIVTGIDAFLNNVDWGAVLGAFAQSFADFIAGALQPGETWAKIMDVWKADFAAMGLTFNLLKDIVVNKFNEIKSDIATAIQGWINLIVDQVQAFVSAGANLIAGLINGIKSQISNVTSVISNVATQVANAFTNIAKLKSPSKLFEEYGINIMAGLQQGIELGSHLPVNAILNGFPKLAGATLAAGGGGSSYVNNSRTTTSHHFGSVNNFYVNARSAPDDTLKNLRRLG